MRMRARHARTPPSEWLLFREWRQSDNIIIINFIIDTLQSIFLHIPFHHQRIASLSGFPFHSSIRMKMGIWISSAMSKSSSMENLLQGNRWGFYLNTTMRIMRNGNGIFFPFAYYYGKRKREEEKNCWATLVDTSASPHCSAEKSFFFFRFENSTKFELQVLMICCAYPPVVGYRLWLRSRRLMIASTQQSLNDIHFDCAISFRRNWIASAEGQFRRNCFCELSHIFRHSRKLIFHSVSAACGIPKF